MRSKMSIRPLILDYETFGDQNSLKTEKSSELDDRISQLKDQCLKHTENDQKDMVFEAFPLHDGVVKKPVKVYQCFHFPEEDTSLSVSSKERKRFSKLLDLSIRFCREEFSELFSYEKRKLKESLLEEAEKGNLEAVERICNQGVVDIGAINSYCHKVLRNAASSGNLQLMQYLCKQEGVDVEEAINDQFWPILNSEVCKKGNLEIVKFLCGQRANVNAPSGYSGDRPLHLAVLHNSFDTEGRFEVVKVLCDRGADVNAINGYGGDTALHIAVQRANLELIKYLYERTGVNVKAVDEYGNTLLHKVAFNPTFAAIKVMQYLYEQNNMDVRAVNCDGNTALHIAARFDNLEVVKFLCNHGSDVMANNKQGKTALYFAENYSRNPEIVKFLRDQMTCGVNVSDISILFKKSF